MARRGSARKRWRIGACLLVGALVGGVGVWFDFRWPNLSVVRQVAGIDAHDVERLEMVGMNLWLGYPEDPRPQVVTDPRRIKEVLDALRHASMAEVGRLPGGVDMYNFFDFQLRPGRGRPGVVICIDGDRVAEDLGPRVKRVFDKYRQR